MYSNPVDGELSPVQGQFSGGFFENVFLAFFFADCGMIVA